LDFVGAAAGFVAFAGFFAFGEEFIAMKVITSASIRAITSANHALPREARATKTNQDQ
jgi:hypothetical protein